MAAAPLPQPQYITWLDNVYPYIGSDKVLVSDSQRNAIPISVANQLVAQAEAYALEDLSPYFQTVPALATVDDKDWTQLPNQTYSIIYYMFVTQASAKLIGNFIARNTDASGEDGRTLSYFQKFYESEYARYLNRILELLKNGGYRYQLIGLKPNARGIPRVPKRYAHTGSLGAPSYFDHQSTNPQLNYDVFWGVNGYGRNGRYTGG